MLEAVPELLEEGVNFDKVSSETLFILTQAKARGKKRSVFAQAERKQDIGYLNQRTKKKRGIG